MHTYFKSNNDICSYNFSFPIFTLYNGYIHTLLCYYFQRLQIFKNYNTINILTLITSRIFNKHDVHILC